MNGEFVLVSGLVRTHSSDPSSRTGPDLAAARSGRRLVAVAEPPRYQPFNLIPRRGGALFMWAAHLCPGRWKK